VNFLKTVWKVTLQLTLKQLRHVSVQSPSSESALLVLATVGSRSLLPINAKYTHQQGKVKCSRYRPGVAQRVGRGIALLFLGYDTRRGWVVSSTPHPHFTPRKDPVPILHEAGWATGSVWTGRKSRPHRDSIPDRPARSQSLYWLSYRAHHTNKDQIIYAATSPQTDVF